MSLRPRVADSDRRSVGSVGGQKRVQTRLRHRSSPDFRAARLRPSDPPVLAGYDRRNSRTTVKRGHSSRKSDRRRSRLLQPLLSGSEKVGGVATDSQSKTVKPVPTHRIVYHGNDTIHPGSSTAKRLDGFHRPQGRVLSHRDPRGFSEVPPLYDKRCRVRVHRSPVRSRLRSSPVYKGRAGAHRVHSPPICPDSPVPRRLAIAEPKQDRTRETPCRSLVDSPSSRLHSEPGEIFSHSLPRHDICRDEIDHSHGDSLSYAGSSRQALTALNYILPLPSIPVKRLLEIIGMMVSMLDIVPWAHLRLRPIQIYLLALWRPSRQPITHVIRVRPALRVHLWWWLDTENLLKGVPLRAPSPTHVLFTDASTTGWGAHLDELTTSGNWSVDQQKRHINWLELQAVFLALQCFQQRINNQQVLVNTDNATVVAYINKKGGTRSPTLCYLTWDLFMWCIKHNVSLRARHLPGKRNHIADALSRDRKVSPTEWAIPQEIADQIFAIWGTPMADLFATYQNRKLPLFVSPLPDLRALAVDALSMSWRNLLWYAFPPLPLLPLVLQKIAREETTVILVAPVWPKRSWYPALLDLLVDRPLALPLRQDLLSQGPLLVHPDPGVFNLHAFKLSSNPSLRTDFLEQLPPPLPDLREPALCQHMRTNGQSSVIGVINRVLIHSKSLLTS